MLAYFCNEAGDALQDVTQACLAVAGPISADGRQVRFTNLSWQADVAEPVIALMTRPETQDQARGIEASGRGKASMDAIRARAEELEGTERALLARCTRILRVVNRKAAVACRIGQLIARFAQIVIGNELIEQWRLVSLRPGA